MREFGTPVQAITPEKSIVPGAVRVFTLTITIGLRVIRKRFPMEMNILISGLVGKIITLRIPPLVDAGPSSFRTLP